ncbi:MAG: ABC transporter substrate-binding protein [Acidimicrobiales bacterium]
MSRRDDTGGRRTPPRPTRLLSLLVASALLASGCGARWDHDQKEAVAARYAAGGGVGGGAQTASGEEVTSDADAGAATASGDQSTASGAPAATGAGTGSSGASGATAPSSKPCAAKSSAPGVTDDQLTIGSISSLSGPVPGIGASAAAAARAYVAYLNSTGGVCGRKIVLKEADDGTDNGRHRAVVTELGPQVLGLAGGFGAGDVGAVDVLRQQKIPVVGLPSGQAVADLPNVFDINPKFRDEHAVIGKYRYLKEHGANTVAVVYLAIEQSRAEARTQRNLMEAAGIKVVLQQELPIQTLSFDSTARKVANSKADYLFFIGDTNSNASMARAMADTGYKLKVFELFTLIYGTSFVQRAGAASEGVVTWLRSLPNEEASSNAALATFNEWMGRVAPSSARDPFAVDSWSSAKALFDALASLPGPITRDALIAQLAKVGTYDAGGLYGPIELGHEVTKGCEVAMTVSGGKWKRLAPAKGFIC